MFQILILILGLFLHAQSNIISLQVSVSTTTINTMANYNFTFQRTYGVYNNFLTASTVALNSYITITFPSSTYTNLTNGAYNCTKIAGTTLSCTMSNNVLNITNYYTTTTATAQTSPTVIVYNITNPLVSGSSGEFQYTITSSNGTVIDTSPPSTDNTISYFNAITLTSGTFASVAITTTGTVSTQSSITITIKPTNSIPTSGYITLTMPSSWTNDVLSSQIVNSSLSCLNIYNVSNSVSCSYSLASGTIITISSLTTQTLSSSFSLTISNILMPPTVSPTDLIAIQSFWGSGQGIDTGSTSLTGVVQSTISTIKFSSLNNVTVSSTFTAFLTITLATVLSVNDTIVVTMPSSIGMPSSASITPFTGFSSTISGTTITFNNFKSSSSILTVNSKVNMTFFNCTNPISIKTTNAVVVSVTRNSRGVQTGSITYTATNGALTFNLTPASYATGFTSSCYAQITTASTIPSGGYVILQYPYTITPLALSSNSLNLCVLNSTSVSGCTYTLNSTGLVFTNIFSTSFAAGTILFNFSQITNPPSVQPVTFALSTYSSDGYLIDTGNFVYTSTSSSLSALSLVSTSTTVLDYPVNLTMSFTASNTFSSFSIVVPSAITIGSSVNTSCLATGISLSQCLYSKSNLTFQGSGNGSISVTWGYNSMPFSFAPTGTFTVYTYLNGFLTQTSSGYIGLTMSTVAGFSSSSSSISSQINNSPSNLTITFQMPTGAPSGNLQISIPSELAISSSLVCMLNSATVSCTVTNQNILVSISNSTLNNTILVYNITTPSSLKPTTSAINISLSDTNNYASLFSTLSAITNLYASTISSAQVSTNMGFLGSLTLLTISANLTGKQSYVIITLPAQFPALSSSPSNSVTLVSSTALQFNTTSTQLSLSLNLTTPTINVTTSFVINTYTSDGYAIETGYTNVWIQKCATTLCKDCSGTTCISCYDSTVSSYTILFNGTCTSACASGNYLVNTTCYACSSNCSTCVNSSTTCTSCANSTYLYTVSNTCLSSCPTTYYSDGSSLTCVKCQSPCLACSSTTTCLSCVSSYYLLNTTCLTACPTGLYIANSGTSKCDLCTANCLTCTNYTFTCTSCNSSNGYYLQGTSCLTSCNSNYFVVNQICTACQSPCLQCLNSTTTCSTCNTSSTYPYFFNYTCINATSCPNGYYINTTQYTCTSCPNICLSCTALLTCSSCINTYYSYNNYCVASCPNTTYLASTTAISCTACSSNCTTCSSATFCTSCPNNYYKYQGVCYQPCPSTTYASGSSCLSCTGGCGNCVNNTFCLTCSTGYYYYSNACYLTCPNGRFANVANMTCDACTTGCATCNSSSGCLTCATSYSMENNTICVVACSRGVSVNQVCYLCGLNCQMCGTACTSCSSGYNLYGGYCMATCPVTTIATAQICQNCSTHYTDCSTCNSTDCLSCSSGALQNGTCGSCPSGKYVSLGLCAACPSVCSICFNQTYCTSCASPNYYYNNYCYSSCPANQVPSGSTCVSCVNNCSKCDQVTTLCLVCTPSFYIYQGGCLSSCPSNLTVSYNGSNCVTLSQYYLQYSAASKIFYFPFTITTCALFILGGIFKYKTPTMHYITFLVALVTFIELAVWAVFGVIQYVVFVNGHFQGIYGIFCLLVALVLIMILNLVNVYFYNRYIKIDNQFAKWIKKDDNYCTVILILTISTITSFKFFRILYSKLLGKSKFQLILTSTNSLKPINFLSLVSVVLCTAPAIAASSLAMYYSVSQDQQYFLAFDCLVVSILAGLLTLLDMHHPRDYLFDQYQANHLHDVYKQDDKLSEVKIAGNQQQNQEIHDPVARTTFYKTNQRFVGQHSEDQMVGAGLKHNVSLEEANSQNVLIQESSEFPLEKPQRLEQQIIQESSDSYDPHDYWINKKIDKFGYELKMNQKGFQQRYDKQGYRIVIDSEGKHIRYDSQGYRIQKRDGKIYKYDHEGFQVVQNQGNLQRYDQRGYQVKEIEGERKFFNKLGYQVKLNSENEEILYNEQGFQMIYNPQQQQYDRYDHQGFLIKGNEEQLKKYDTRGYEVKDIDGMRKFFNKQGYEVRKNSQGQEVLYNSQGYKMIYNVNKYDYQKFDAQGFLVIQKEGQIKKYDQRGYQVKDINGERKYYNALGFEVRNNQLNEQILYNHQGLKMVYNISKQSYDKYDSEGLLINEDEGKRRKYDNRGYQVIDLNGRRTYYNKQGYQVRTNSQNEELLFDKQGYRLIYNSNTKKYDRYDEEGYRIENGQKGEKIRFDSEGYRVVYQDGHLNRYDEDNLRVVKDKQGKITKYDQLGLRVQKDKFGNLNRFDEHGFRVKLGWNNSINRYDQEGNTVIIDPTTGQVTKYDPQGYELRNVNGRIIRFDKNGFRVEKNYYGTVTLYDDHDLEVLIDSNGKITRYNQQGLRVQIKQGDKYQYYDKRGHKVVTDFEGNYQKFDLDGNQIWLDEEGYEIERDQNGNMLKYDKIGNCTFEPLTFVVEEDDDDIQQDRKITKEQVKRKLNKRKMVDHEKELQMMVKEEFQNLGQSNIVFSEMDLDELPDKQIVDLLPEQQLQKDLNQMVNSEFGHMQIEQPDLVDLSELKQMRIIPHQVMVETKSIRSQKVQQNQGQIIIEQKDDQVNLRQEHLMSQVEEPKSVRDIQLSQRTEQNQGVLPPNEEFGPEQQQESMELDKNMIIDLSKIKTKNRVVDNTSQISNEIFDHSPIIETKTEYNKRVQGYDMQNGQALSQYKLKTNKSQLKISSAESRLNTNLIRAGETAVNKRIYDPDEQIESVGNSEDWDNQQAQANIFFLNNQNNKIERAKDEVEKKPIIDFIEEEFDNKDTLSDYIDQEFSKERSRKELKQEKVNNVHRPQISYLASNLISEEEKLFNTIDTKKPKIISHTPNPLISYAQSIEAAKGQQQKMKSLEKIYLQANNRRK